MANDSARRNKRLAKQKAKRSEKRIQLARQSSSDPTVRLANADRWPIATVYIPENLWDIGLGQAFIARQMPDGLMACGFFLLDTYCLGIKDAFWAVRTPSECKDLVQQLTDKHKPRVASPEYFSKLVHCTADYGQSLGFHPHPSFRHVRMLLHGIDPALCHEEFQFGRDGKPLYIVGPNESPEKARLIAQRVNEANGFVGTDTNVPVNIDELFDDGGYLDDDDE